MTEENKNMESSFVLSLLDDAQTPAVFHQEGIWSDLLEKCQNLNIPPQPATPAMSVRTDSPPERVFRTQTSLRDLMREYNGRQTAMPPIKSDHVRPTQEFEFRQEDDLELIRIPSIPGKVLRPV